MREPDTTSRKNRDSPAVHGVQARRPDTLRPLLVGLGLSTAIHVVAILLYPSLSWRFQSPDIGAFRGPSSDFEATRIVNLVEPPEPSTEPPPVQEEPQQEPEPEELAPSTPAPTTTFPEESREEAVDPATAAERLRPRDGDDRIWRPVDPDRTRLTAEELAELRIRGALNAWNDSLGAAADARARAMDWTTTDEDGNRWGVSPGRIHLGKFSLPFPFSFGAGGAGNRQETDRRQWEWADIERGAAGQEVRETLKDRAKAIRERKDQERAEEADTTGGRVR